MKIAVSGKGGVGKTTLSAMLAGCLSLKGRHVVALDADPDANLAAALGVPADQQPTPLSEMRELVAERTGAKPGVYGGYFKLNPRVDDIPEAYARHIGNVRLLALGGVKEGGAGCICPATALVKALLTHLILGRDEAVIMDMEAGIEHLGRATAASMDALLLVVNEDPWSIQTAQRTRKLAADLGMTRLLAVVNRLTDESKLEAVRGQLGEIPLVGGMPYDPRLAGGVARTVGDRLEPTEGLEAHLDDIERILAALQAAAED
jgi:CO dehydrogenase maturation factor